MWVGRRNKSYPYMYMQRYDRKPSPTYCSLQNEEQYLFRVTTPADKISGVHTDLEDVAFLRTSM